LLLSAALHNRGRAYLARAWGRRRAFSRLRALNLWATRARAWRAITLGLRALAAI